MTNTERSNKNYALKIRIHETSTVRCIVWTSFLISELRIGIFFRRGIEQNISILKYIIYIMFTEQSIYTQSFYTLT